MPRPSATTDPYAPTLDDQSAEGGDVAHEAAPDPLIPADGNWTRVSMRRFLAAQPQRSVAISRDHNDKQSGPAYHDVWYQGFRWPIQKGRSVQVPEPIAQIVEQMDQEFRTSQARNRAAYINDIGTGDGPELFIDGAR